MLSLLLPMPPRWPRQPTRQDPDYRKLDDRYTLAAHIAIFLTSSTGLEFFHRLWRSDWPWLLPLLGWWGLGLGLHSLWVLVIARYPANPLYQEQDPISEPPPQPESSNI
ncbi:MAG: hypothetical protein NW237_14350 [Cyanobacteriota bacterium]|nr:hypothetical protein [Cyanobacteriota bacterium]